MKLERFVAVTAAVAIGVLGIGSAGAAPSTSAKPGSYYVGKGKSDGVKVKIGLRLRGDDIKEAWSRWNGLRCADGSRRGVFYSLRDDGRVGKDRRFRVKTSPGNDDYYRVEGRISRGGGKVSGEAEIRQAEVPLTVPACSGGPLEWSGERVGKSRYERAFDNA